MVKQGTIIKVNFNPTIGHEQAGYRPAVVVSNDGFNKRSPFVIACPITNTNREFPLHVQLDERTKTTGLILCDQIKTLDLTARTFHEEELLPKDILKSVLDIIFAEIEPL